ncbi:hypothetical protein N7462_007859 [Penicillium macrosclerotiorum]|uniref:uncharacterized protein n=1 Tax=Penicillium macrosclerotiorum TaxID=303699 RepID=UPI002546FE46|nr:uncharacterized protein N7462_007859 [Penicillium macrosclerotiorum]KAJ5679615.1 hypothetical protein N7462_007859 [Penicillium macrosclerotiorum]
MLEGAPQPDSRVQNFEEECIRKGKDICASKGQLARRPGYGTKGRPIILRTNFFEMAFDKNVRFYSYRIGIKPEPEPKRHLKDIFKKLLEEEKVIAVKAATDGVSELVTCAEIKDTRPLPISVDMNGNGEKKNYQVSFNFHGIIDHNQVLTGLRDATMKSQIPDEAISIRALNILMGRSPYHDPGIVTIGKGGNKFFRIDQRCQSMYLEGGLDCIRGFFGSVRLSAGRILLNVNVNHGAFYRPGPLAFLVNEFEKVFGQDRHMFNKYVKGIRVELSHLKHETKDGKEPRVKVVWGLATPRDGRRGEHPPRVPRVGSCADNVEFYMYDRDKPQAKGRYISVTNYFKQEYKMTLRYGDKPVMNVGNTERPTYLPLDVCTILPGQIYHGELGTAQRRNIIKFSCRRPPENYTSITQDGLDIIGVNRQDTDKLGIHINPKMTVVPGRILNAPSLKYGSKKEVPRFGAWNLINKRFCSAATINRWTGVLIRRVDRDGRPINPPGNVENALKSFYAKSKDLGINMSIPILPVHNVDLNQNETKQPAQIGMMFDKMKELRVELVLVLLPNGADRVFEFVKWVGDTKAGILNHCCLASKFIPGNDQYMANNSLKINLRMGGVNQVLETPPTLLSSGKTIVVGLDVTHPSPTDPDTFPSIASIVASVDGRLGQWPGQVKIQQRRMENVQFLKEMLLARLQRWKKDNKELPQNILIYRDGVSEGQYQMVLTEEMKGVRDAIQAIYKNEPPRVTILVCGKRHNVRFFPTAQQDCDRTSNPINGTVVDRGVTRPIYWDFYLQAQSPLQGSARPAHYIVIHDEIFGATARDGAAAVDSLQELTHSICYMMGRCTRSISYSTPAFLADRFADRARKYVRAYYFEKQYIQNVQDAPGPDDIVSRLSPNVSENMVYI